MTRRTKKKILDVVVYIFLSCVSLVSLIPLIYVVLTSLKTYDQVYDVNEIIPTTVTLANYITVVGKANFMMYFKNSVIVAVCTTLVCMILSVAAGYGMTRYRLLGAKKLKTGILYTRMFPAILLALPYYVIMRNLHLGDSLPGLMLIYCSFTIPFTIWNMQTFFMQIPWELEDAARIDGCTRTQALFRVIMPLARPGIIATALFSFMTCWDEYMFANLFISSDSKKTISLGIRSFVGEYSTDWGCMMAATVIAMLPVIIFFLYAQKNLVSGLSAGAVKG
ncbi:MAG: carbohydrate ABC transporter permease [Lachnospiraceae bacterium]|nr:carbohydrate ABC transporter permease [Lachnospiraceae bacterium]